MYFVNKCWCMWQAHHKPCDRPYHYTMFWWYYRGTVCGELLLWVGERERERLLFSARCFYEGALRIIFCVRASYILSPESQGRNRNAKPAWPPWPESALSPQRLILIQRPAGGQVTGVTWLSLVASTLCTKVHTYIFPTIIKIRKL